MLWESYKKRPEVGVTREEVFAMIEQLGGRDVLDLFASMIQTTEDIPLEKAMQTAGAEFVWEEPVGAWLGISPEINENRVYVNQVVLDGPAYQAGLNSKDELVAIDGIRILKDQYDKLEGRLQIDKNYCFTVCRNGILHEIECSPSKKPRVLKEISLKNEALFKQTFGMTN